MTSGKLLATIALPLFAACLSACVSTAPDRGSSKDAAKANTDLAAAYLQRGDVDFAMKMVDKALEQDDEFAPAYLVKGAILARAKEFDEADDYYEDAARYAGEDAVVLNNVAAYYCERGRYRHGEEIFLDVARMPTFSRPAIAYTNAGMCARRIPAPDRAEQHFRRALGLEPTYRLALWHMASLCLEQGENLDARAFLQRLEGVQRLGPDGLWLGVRIERGLRDEAAARRYADILLRDFPESPEARQLSESNDSDR